MKRLCAHYSFWAPKATVKVCTGPKTKRLDENSPTTPSTELTDDLPPVLHRPKDTLLTSLPDFNQNSYQFVVFDLETTGLERNSEICQIAAERVDTHKRESWSAYILPNVAINPRASLVTGLVVKYAGNDRYLTHYGQCVKATSSRDGIMSFYRHLKELSEAARHTILIGYCSKQFDVPVLCHSFRKYGITGEKLEELGICFAESYKVLKDIFTSRAADKTAAQTATLTNIYESIFGEPFQAHNAVNDVNALSRIIFDSHCKPPPESLLSQATVAGSAFASMEFFENKSKLLNTMNDQLFSDNNTSSIWPLTRYLAMKTAASGLDYNDMKRIYKKWGEVGIDTLCRTVVKSDSGKRTYRITNNQNVIKAICTHFEDYYSH